MQYAFFPRETEHGGYKRKGKRKTNRPLAIKKPMHVIFKSDKAKGASSFLRKPNATFIRTLLAELSPAYGVNVREFSNVGNHLHLAVKARDRRGLQNFLRVFASKIAIKLTGARKGKTIGKFWTQAVYTRLVDWGADYWNVACYIRNQFSPTRTAQLY